MTTFLKRIYRADRRKASRSVRSRGRKDAAGRSTVLPGARSQRSAEQSSAVSGGMCAALRDLFQALVRRRITILALFSLGAILLHLALRFGLPAQPAVYDAPLLAVLIAGGFPLVLALAKKAWAREFGSDLLGGISIITAVILGEYLAGSIIVLMLAGGEALENYAMRRASSVLAALAKRMPSIAHRKRGDEVVDVEVSAISAGEIVVMYPHELSPVDGIVVDGHGAMDESLLTGEPFKKHKTVGSSVISGAVNGEAALAVRATHRAADSRYARIMEVMRETEAKRPRLRRLGDSLGAIYTPIALFIAFGAWVVSGEAHRFLSVLVIATPCPLLLAIPIAIAGAVSLCAQRAIIVKSPVVLEQIASCRTAIFDKTGTLTYGRPALTGFQVSPSHTREEVLALVASLERYSKHPLAVAILEAAKEAGIALSEASEVSEEPGQGLRGNVLGHSIRISSRSQLRQAGVVDVDRFPAAGEGLECIVAMGGCCVAALHFRDTPRQESGLFIRHLGLRHQFEKIILLSGDRRSEVDYLAKQVGITEVFAEKSPEEKLAIVRGETQKSRTLYVGDGINDAPAMLACTVGVAIGQNSDVTAEAAGVVVMDNSLERIDEFMHISRRMRRIALQSAIGGMCLSLAGMMAAFSGHLEPVNGAIAQEVIDFIAVVNALRSALPPRTLHDF